MMGAGIEKNPVAAAERTLLQLTEFVNQKGAKDRLRFTAALSNGKDLYAFRYAVNDRANTLYYRESDIGIVVVSEPLDSDRDNWVPVPENHVLVASASGRARIVPFLQRQQEAAE
jgi:glutamine amidotransferase